MKPELKVAKPEAKKNDNKPTSRFQKTDKNGVDVFVISDDEEKQEVTENVKDSTLIEGDKGVLLTGRSNVSG